MAAEALRRIAGIYEVEREAKDLDGTARHDYRAQHAKPQIESLFEWLSTLRTKMSGNSGAANATDYLLRRKASYLRYLEDGRYPIDNNPIENAIRPIALGRKNWLFAGSERWTKGGRDHEFDSDRKSERYRTAGLSQGSADAPADAQRCSN